MRTAEAQLRRIIKEELVQDDAEFIEVLADICRSRWDHIRLTDVKIQNMTKIVPPAEREAAEIMQAILTRVLEMPHLPPFSAKGFLWRLSDALDAVDRTTIRNKFPTNRDINLPQTVKDIDSMMYYLTAYYSENNRRRAQNIHWISDFMTRYNSVKADPDAPRIWLALRDAVPKLAKFFGDKQNREYEDQIVRLLKSQDYESVLQAAELADMMS